MATTTECSVLVGVFDDDQRARKAVRTLQAIGFARHQLGYVVRHGEVLEAGGVLAEVDAPEHDLAGGLIILGVPFVQARLLWLELERGRAIVTVQSAGGIHAARCVLELADAASLQTFA
jgi:hypothetical protein